MCMSRRPTTAVRSRGPTICARLIKFNISPSICATLIKFDISPIICARIETFDLL